MRIFFIFMILELFLGLFFLYLLVVFGLSLIFVPNLGFKRKIVEVLPDSVIADISKIVDSSNNKKDVLSSLVDYQLSFFYSRMGFVIPKFWLLFESSFNKLWSKKGFLHCHQQNFVMRTLLLNTGLFSEEDIKLVLGSCYFNIHQYLLVNVGSVNKEWVFVDCFAISMGYPLGDHLNVFHFSYSKRNNFVRRPIYFY